MINILDLDVSQHEPSFEILKSKIYNLPRAALSMFWQTFAYIWIFMLVIHHLRVFATSNAQTIFQIFKYGSMQFFMGFLKVKSEFW